MNVAETSLELLLFGTMEVKSKETLPRGLSAKGKLLLAYLALHEGRPVAMGMIAEDVFPDSQAEDPRDLIKKTASEIRRFLGAEGYRLSSPGPRMLAFDLEGVDVDWREFRNALKKGDTESLQHAIALHSRPFLETQPLPWAMEEQANCLHQRQQALEILFQRARANGDFDSAGNWLSQMLKFALPGVTIREELWREWIETLLKRQEYGQIRAQYTRLQTFLEHTAGRTPEAETQALYHRIPKSILLQMAQAGSKKKRSGLPDSARLPHYPCALIGRDIEKKELLGAFKSSQLVTVLGIGGIGKTRFAVQVGYEIEADFRDGVGFVDLTTSTSDMVLPTLTSTLGLKENSDKLPYETLREFLCSKCLLLILDNCEHVVAEVASLVSDLIRDCPQLRLLLTSREMLRIDGEQVFALPPLALPERRRSKRASPTLASSYALESPAVRLFVERAKAVNPGFRLTHANSNTIATLCQFVDGLPLGIEIVASQAASVPLERIARDLLESGLRLQHAKRGVLPRHQTLHAALDWSYGMLSEAEKQLLRRLSVFTGGWTLEAAEQVCTDETLPQTEIALVLSELVTKSLVVIELSDQYALPYRFLETIRAYGEALLRQHEESKRLQQTHCRYYLKLLTELGDLSKIKEYLVAVDQNRSNVYAALQRSLEEPELLPVGHQISMLLDSYWAHRGLRAEGCDWHRSFMKAGMECLPPAALAASLLKIADYSAFLSQGDSEEAIHCRERAFEIYRNIGDRKGESDIYFSIGMRLSDKQRHAEGYRYFQKAYDYYQHTEHYYRIGFILIMMSGCLNHYKRFDRAFALEQKALDIARAHKMRSLEGLALMFLGFNSRDQNLLESAERYFTQSIAAYNEVDSHWGVVRSQSHWANIKRRQGDFQKAREILISSLSRAIEFSNSQETLYILIDTARVLHDEQSWESCLALSAGLMQLHPVFLDEINSNQKELKAAIADAVAHLDTEVAKAILSAAQNANIEALQEFTHALLQESSSTLSTEE